MVSVRPRQLTKRQMLAPTITQVQAENCSWFNSWPRSLRSLCAENSNEGETRMAEKKEKGQKKNRHAVKATGKASHADCLKRTWKR